MTRLRTVLEGIVEFIAGDDIPLAIGIVLTVALTYALGRNGTDVWWLPPVAVAGLVAISVWRVARRRR